MWHAWKLIFQPMLYTEKQSFSLLFPEMLVKDMFNLEMCVYLIKTYFFPSCVLLHSYQGNHRCVCLLFN